MGSFKYTKIHARGDPAVSRRFRQRDINPDYYIRGQPTYPRLTPGFINHTTSPTGVVSSYTRMWHRSAIHRLVSSPFSSIVYAGLVFACGTLSWADRRTGGWSEWRKKHVRESTGSASQQRVAETSVLKNKSMVGAGISTAGVTQPTIFWATHLTTGAGTVASRATVMSDSANATMAESSISTVAGDSSNAELKGGFLNLASTYISDALDWIFPIRHRRCKDTKSSETNIIMSAVLASCSTPWSSEPVESSPSQTLVKRHGTGDACNKSCFKSQFNTSTETEVLSCSHTLQQTQPRSGNGSSRDDREKPRYLRTDTGSPTVWRESVGEDRETSESGKLDLNTLETKLFTNHHNMASITINGDCAPSPYGALRTGTSSDEYKRRDIPTTTSSESTSKSTTPQPEGVSENSQLVPSYGLHQNRCFSVGSDSKFEQTSASNGFSLVKLNPFPIKSLSLVHSNQPSKRESVRGLHRVTSQARAVDDASPIINPQLPDQLISLLLTPEVCV